MPVTGLFYLPLAPNTPSPGPQLISHLSRNFEANLLPSYSLDHRLLFDTSSLLPGHPVSARKYTQFLTLAHHAGRTYVGTTSNSSIPTPNASTMISSGSGGENNPAGGGGGAAPTAQTPPMTVITIPSGLAADDFFATVLKKMEPLWAIRSTVAIANGGAFSLDGGDWNVRIGDLRVTGGQGTGRVRGVIVEVQYLGTDAGDDEGEGEGGKQQQQQAKNANGEGGDDAGDDADEKNLRAFWAKLLDGSRVSTDGMRVVVRVSGMEEKNNNSNNNNNEKKQKQSAADAGLDLAKQYMELLRFARV